MIYAGDSEATAHTKVTDILRKVGLESNADKLNQIAGHLAHVTISASPR